MTNVDPAAYVLGLLEGEDLREARRLETESPEFAAEVRALAQVGVRLDALEVDEWDAVGPPPLRLDVAAPQTKPRPRRSWLAGVDGAEPGIIMPGTFLLGSAYYQEIAPDVALDRAYHAEMDLEVEVPAGTFDDCVFVLEDSDFEPGVYSEKTYAPGVGLISDGELELIWFGQIDGCSGSPDATEEE